MKALIPVAGYATRLYPLTETTPKALLPIKGITILDHILENVERIKEVNEIILVSNEKFFDKFNNWAKTYKGKLPIHIINDHTTNNENRLGAIGDINLAIQEKKLNDDLIVLAGDNYFTYDLKDLYNYYKKVNTNLIIGSRVSEEILKQRKYGIVEIDCKGKVIGFEEKPENPKSNIIVPAIYIYKKETVPLFKKYLDEGNNKDAMGGIISWLYKITPIQCYEAKGSFVDIGTLETYNELNKKA